MVSEKQRKESAPPVIPSTYSLEKTKYFLAEAMYAFDAASEKELSLAVGDYVVVRKVSLSGWSEGECRGTSFGTSSSSGGDYDWFETAVISFFKLFGENYDYELLTKRHRELLVSIRFNEPGWQWSGCFLPDHLGDTQVKMQDHVSGAVSMIRDGT
ncbi:SH3 domain-containing protein 3 [Camellia lanceoleosa]|uniref:SH3 domain-containing protein 3 n=1 Tax=Camellia lanceoleosa TaxID=1840588 RepID=A0ACC0GH14_9ERIC|nr:SH3 domain-containing protein 3 [Camellia lanceoleosa]